MAQGQDWPGSEGKLYYRIGEVSRITDMKPYVLRYWESEFRWMAPQKSRSKQRLYRKKDIQTILLIKKLLYEERYTIAGARRRLRELGVGKAREQVAQTTQLAMTDHRRAYGRIRDELVAIRRML
jgi:DNA-binding transcriptional MerR regulator